MNRRSLVLGLLAFAVVPTEVFARRRKSGSRKRTKSVSKTYKKTYSTVSKTLKKPTKYTNKVNKSSRIKATSLNVRDKPKLNSRVIGSVKRNQMYTILEVDGWWGRINYKGRTGWISLEHTY